MRLIELTGKRFGNLFVTHREKNTPFGQARWACVCDCGNATVVCGYHLRHSRTRSCGCMSIRLGESNHFFKHGGRGTPEYRNWKAMHERCRYKRHVRWKLYGGRGITVCERWDDFSNFLTDMGPRPTRKHSIDRINNDGDYERKNCRWATPKQQAGNRRPRVNVAPPLRLATR